MRLHRFALILVVSCAGFGAACTSILGDFAVGSGDGGGGDGGGGDGGGGDGAPDGNAGPVTLDQNSAKLGILRSTTFHANQAVTWSVQEAGGGTVDANGKYISPVTPGIYHVVATSTADAKQSATATITVVDLAIQLLAGSGGGSGNIDGPAQRAHFQEPQGGTFTVANNIMVYIADTGNHTIRVYDESTKKVTTLAGLAGSPGTLDGIGSAARFNGPEGVAMAPQQGGTVYVADTQNNCIRAIDISGKVTTFSGACGANGASFDGTGDVNGQPGTARFNRPSSIVMNAASPAPTALDVCDTGTWGDNRIRRVDLNDGSVTTLVPGIYSCQLVTDRYWHWTYFTDAGGAGHLKHFQEGSSPLYTPTIGDDGQMPNYGPGALGTDNGWGNGQSTYLFFNNGGGDWGITFNTWNPTSFSANPVLGSQNQYGYVDGPGTTARFESVAGIVSMPEYRRLYLVDRGLEALRHVDLYPSVNVTTDIGAARVVDRIDGPATSARFSGLLGVAVDDNGVYYLSDLLTDGAQGLLNNTVRTFDPSTSTVASFAGVPGYPLQTAVDGAKGTGSFSFPFFSVFENGILYVIDVGASAVRTVDATGKISTLAGQLMVPGNTDNVGVAAQFAFSVSNGVGAGITSDHNGNLYVSDGGNYSIRKIEIATGKVTTVAGGTKGTGNGTGKAAQFIMPAGLAVDGNTLYIADFGDHTIRQMDLGTFKVSSFLGLSGDPGYVDGDASKAQLNSPLDLVADGLGNLFLTEFPAMSGIPHTGTIRRIDIPNATISTFVGSRASFGLAPGPRTTATVNCPISLAITPSGDLAFGDFCDYALAVLRPL